MYKWVVAENRAIMLLKIQKEYKEGDEIDQSDFSAAELRSLILTKTITADGYPAPKPLPAPDGYVIIDDKLDIDSPNTVANSVITAKFNEVDANITAESERATAAESTLETSIQTVNDDLTAQIEAEKEARKKASTSSEVALEEFDKKLEALTNSVSTNTTKISENVLAIATNGEKILELQANLETETIARKSNDDDLQASIDGEIQQREQNEQSMQNQIQSIQSEVSDIKSTLSTAYRIKGSCNFVDLPSLDDAEVGDVYNIKDSFTTTADFEEGAGLEIEAGTNIVCISHSVESENEESEKSEEKETTIKKWDVLATAVDFSKFYTKTESDEQFNKKITVAENTDALSDSDSFLEHNANSTNPTSILRKPFTLLWNYIKGKITGAISGIVEDVLTANRVLVSDDDGKITVSGVTATELGYLSGASSNLQTQIDAETSARKSADTSITNRVSALETVDTSITNRVSALETANEKTQTVPNESGMLTGRESSGLSISGVYGGISQGYPTQYGNLITIGGMGGSQLLLGWSGVTNGVADVFYRNRRDNQDTWSPWKRLAFA